MWTLKKREKGRIIDTKKQGHIYRDRNNIRFQFVLLLFFHTSSTSGVPRVPFGFEEAFKEGRGIQGGKFLNLKKKIQNFKILYFSSHPSIMGSP